MPPPIRHAGVPGRGPGMAGTPIRRHPAQAGRDPGGMRFLIDECLSIDLISIASYAGHEAQHVARIGKAGWKTGMSCGTAAAGDFVLVTNAASDFRKLYATTPLHADLIIIVPNVDRGLHRRCSARRSRRSSRQTTWSIACSRSASTAKT